MEPTSAHPVDRGTLGLILRARVFSYTFAAVLFVAAGILQTAFGWIIVVVHAGFAAMALRRILKPGGYHIWTVFVDILIAPVTAVIVGQDPSSVHLLVGAQVVAALLVPRSKVTIAITLTGAFAVVAGMLVAGVPPIVPLPPGGYPVVERGIMILGILFGTPLVLLLSNRSWRSQQQLAAYAERDRHSAEAQRRLVSVVSHEFRTPLASILGFAEVIATDEELTTTERKEFAETIHTEAGHLSRLVNDLLDHLRLDLDRLSVQTQPVDAADLLRRLVLGNEARGHDLVGDGIPPSAPAMADADRLYQVVRNLIDNAFRYGGPEVRVGIDEREDEIDIWVHDDGSGLPPDRVDELFDEYAQAEEGRGLGLGLSIARRLTEAMGGTLTYDGAAEGARFVIRLPKPTTMHEGEGEKSGTLRTA